MKLWLIGSGSPRPTRERFGTCYILQVGDEYLMIDCGPASTYKMVKVGILPTQINHLFITHHHYDHIIDLPCFLMTRWYMDRGSGETLRIWGPAGTTRLVYETLELLRSGWKSRLAHKASRSGYLQTGGVKPRPYPWPLVRDIVLVEGGPTNFYHIGWTITVSPALHYQPWLPSLAYRVNTEGGDVVFTGDTYSWRHVGDLAMGADVVVATCWDHQEVVDQVPGSVWGTLDVARFAQDAGVGKLVLSHSNHTFPEPKSRARALKEIAEIYSGEIVFGEELMCIEIG